MEKPNTKQDEGRIAWLVDKLREFEAENDHLVEQLRNANIEIFNLKTQLDLTRFLQKDNKDLKG